MFIQNFEKPPEKFQDLVLWAWLGIVSPLGGTILKQHMYFQIVLGFGSTPFKDVCVKIFYLIDFLPTSNAGRQ